MPIRNTRTVTWKPRGCSDALDGSNVFQGAALNMINLVPNPGTMDQWVCRPARDYLTNFVNAAFSTNPTTVRGNPVILADTIFGFITTTRNPGHDEPYAVSAITGQVVSVSGVTVGNTPTTDPNPVGATQLPIGAVVGPYVVFTHPGFAGGIYNPNSFSASITGNVVAGQSTITGFFAGQIYPGMVVSAAAGLAPGTVATSGVQTVDINQSSSGIAGNNFFTVANSTGLFLGMSAIGTGLSGYITAIAGTTITITTTLATTFSNQTVAFHGNTVSISPAATATAANQPIAFNNAPDRSSVFGWFDLTGANISVPATLVSGNPNAGVASIAGLSAGMNVAGAGIPAGTRIANILNPTYTSQPGNIGGGQTGLYITVSYQPGTLLPLPVPQVGSTVTGPGLVTGTVANATALISQTATQTVFGITLNNPALGTALITGLFTISGLYTAVLSQAATIGGSSTLTITGGTIAAPLWCGGTTAINPLPSTPIGVGNFNGRAYFACQQDGAPFSDVQNPASITNASQAIIPGNREAVTACVGQPLLSPVSGGMTSAMYLFQSDLAVQQVTGDQQFGNLAVQALNVATGTQSPAAIVPTTLGMAFISPEGVRMIDFSGTIGQPIGEAGSGVTLPFVNIADHSRAVGAANGNVIRFALQNGQQIGQPWIEWWYDLPRKVWSGPHTLQTSAIASYGDTFITAAQDVPAQLYKSPSQPSGFVDFEEDGSTLTWEAQTCLMPDTGAIAENAVVEATLGLVHPSDQPVSIQALNETGTVLDSVMLPGPYSMPLWGGPQLWGTGLWYAVPDLFRQERLNWHKPLVFKQARFRITGLSRFGLTIGSLRLRYEQLGYLSYWPTQSLDISVPPLPTAPVIQGQPQAVVVAAGASQGTVIGTLLAQLSPHGAAQAAAFILEYNQSNLLALAPYNNSAILGSTNGTTTIGGFSANALTAGWLPGHMITDSRGTIPAGTYIVSIAAGGLSATLSQAAVASAAGDQFIITGTNLVTNWTSAPSINKIIGEVQGIAAGALTSYWPFIVTVTP